MQIYFGSISEVQNSPEFVAGLLLPTKLTSVNNRVKELNNIMREIAFNHKNILIVNHPFDELCNANDCLKDECGRFDKTSGTPLSQDVLHLGKQGLRLLAISLKSSIMGKYKRNGGRQHTAAAESGHSGGT